jgi:hypothetical protein
MDSPSSENFFIRLSRGVCSSRAASTATSFECLPKSFAFVNPSRCYTTARGERNFSSATSASPFARATRIENSQIKLESSHGSRRRWGGRKLLGTYSPYEKFSFLSSPFFPPDDIRMSINLEVILFSPMNSGRATGSGSRAEKGKAPRKVFKDSRENFFN